MERICYLLRMNVQLVFVFDGPNKPVKRHSTGKHYSDQNVAVLKELLDQLGVPRHEAPGEAEAECAKLQRLGVVDAVWSDDSDTFMFGCDTVVQFYRPEGSEFKSEDDVLVYTAQSIKNRSHLSQQGVLMHAILVGCDYADGLFGFGSSTLLELAKHHKFEETAEILAVSVSNNHRGLSKWRAMLFRMMKDTFPSKNFSLPPNSFPNPEVLENCSCPNVSSDHQLLGLVSNWFRPFGPNLYARYIFLLQHFHSRKSRYWPVQYLVPIELNHRLREKANDFDYGIAEKIVTESRKEATMMVDPLLVIPEFLDVLPFGYEFGKVEAKLLDCVVRRALPNLTEKVIEKKSRDRPRKVPSGQNMTNMTNRASSHNSRERESLNNRQLSKKRGPNSLGKDSAYNPLDLNNQPPKKLPRLEGRTNQTDTDLLNANGYEKGLSERHRLVIDDIDDSSRNGSPMEPPHPTSHQKHASDGACLTDITVIDLTEVD
ncbi:hypothetical protein ABKA04_003086 [Annulohypoxylon sp. FPYF3050]